MTRLALSRAARQDLLSIAGFTEGRWGVARRNTMLRDFDRAFRSLAANPAMGRACNEIREGYRKLPLGTHVIYYRAEADHVLVVRVLHAAMDVDTGLDN